MKFFFIRKIFIGFFFFLELLRVDSQPVSNSTRRLSCQLSDDIDNGIEDEDEDILETTTWETSPKRMKRWVDVNEN